MSGTQIHVKQWEQQSGTSHLGSVSVREKRFCQLLTWVRASQPRPSPLQFSQISSFACDDLTEGADGSGGGPQVCDTSVSKHPSRSQGVGRVSVHCAPAPQLCDEMTLTILIPTHFNCFPELYRNKNHSHTVVRIREIFLPSQPQMTFGIYQDFNFSEDLGKLCHSKTFWDSWVRKWTIWYHKADLVSHFNVSADWTGPTGMETFKFIMGIPHKGGTLTPLPVMCTVLLFLRDTYI